MLSFKLSPPLNATSSPEWVGGGFRLGQQIVPVLEYSENFAGWSDDLTALHEEAAGESHPIDVASRNDALRQLQANLSTKTPCILEIGCSSGFMLKKMKLALPDATIVGADVVREPLYRLAKELPSVPLLRFDLLQCPLPSDSFDAVVMLNVLEHIEDDLSALVQVHRILKPGGIAVIEVPAGPHLYDAYDRALKHFRRYDMVELAAKLRKAGFSVERQSHLGFFLYSAFAMVKRRNQRQQGQEDPNALVKAQASDTSSSGLLKLAVAVERVLGNWFSYPTGIRCLALGRKAA
ncbi:MAG: class I SAM-dependent methyltransferase [Burkholderiales bacterium]|nr:class I SAM-dependent methyltransferase [Burkholderiales bacterium]MBY0577377.1 class I SAM-dependent methyltransferase [Gallionellaceae bacterium]